jgi:hypothetical protein|tara:strand:+ start:2199 stop:2717 length:519 start_codon:yes stop_codon:yes gene_type:complete
MAKQSLTLEAIQSKVDGRVSKLASSGYEHADVQTKKWKTLLKSITKADVEAAAKKLDVDADQVLSFFEAGQIYAVQKTVAALMAIGRGDKSAFNTYDRHILSLFASGKDTVSNDVACKSIASKLSKTPKTASTQRSSSAKSLQALGVLTATSSNMTVNDKSMVYLAITATVK